MSELTVLLSIMTMLVLTNGVSAVMDPGTRNRWLNRLLWEQVLFAGAEMEQAGWGIRDVGAGTRDGDIRRQGYLRFLVTLIGLVLVLWICAAVRVPWWLVSTVVSIFIVLSIIPRRSALAWKAFSESPDTVEVPPISAPSLGSLSAWLVLFIGVTLVYAAISLDSARAASGTPVVVLAVAGLALMAAAGNLIRLSRRRVPRGLEGSMERAALLLRSFSEDKRRIRMFDPEVGILGTIAGSRARLEECIEAFAGELIAIGKPGEKLPELGAIRTYASDDDWQATIEYAARHVRRIYALAGGSSGLEWELEHLREWGLLDKTIVLIPPVKLDELRSLLPAVFRLFGCDASELDRMDHISWALTLCLTGVGSSPEGNPVFYLAEGRDWASYAATIVLFDRSLSGEIVLAKDRIAAEDSVPDGMGYETASNEAGGPSGS